MTILSSEYRTLTNGDLSVLIQQYTVCNFWLYSSQTAMIPVYNTAHIMPGIAQLRVYVLCKKVLTLSCIVTHILAC